MPPLPTSNISENTAASVSPSSQLKRENDLHFWISQYVDFYNKTYTNFTMYIKPNTEKEINQIYWDFIETKVRPFLEKKHTMPVVDRHKIISVMELCIMYYLPLWINDIDNCGQQARKRECAKLGLAIGKNIIKSWNNDITSTSFPVFEREHITLLMGVNFEHFPVFSNAATWYLYEQLIVEKNKNIQ